MWSTAHTQKRIYGFDVDVGFETINQLAMTNSVHWYGDVLRREYRHVLRTALYFEVKGQRKKGHGKS